MPDHRFALSAEVHEPKHITSTTTADAGKVITPSATVSGTSELRSLTPAEVGITSPEDVGVQYVYGEMAVDQNNVAVATTAALDATLYTTTDYTHINSTVLAGVYLDHSNGVTFDNVDNALIVPVAGDYRIKFWANIVSDTNNSKVGFKVKKNGTWCNFTVKEDISSLGRVQNVHGSIITDCLAGSPLTLHVACDKTANITIQDVRVMVELIKGA